MNNEELIASFEAATDWHRKQHAHLLGVQVWSGREKFVLVDFNDIGYPYFKKASSKAKNPKLYTLASYTNRWVQAQMKAEVEV